MVILRAFPFTGHSERSEESPLLTTEIFPLRVAHGFGLTSLKMTKREVIMMTLPFSGHPEELKATKDLLLFL